MLTQNTKSNRRQSDMNKENYLKYIELYKLMIHIVPIMIDDASHYMK